MIFQPYRGNKNGKPQHPMNPESHIFNLPYKAHHLGIQHDLVPKFSIQFRSGPQYVTPAIPPFRLNHVPMVINC